MSPSELVVAFRTPAGDLLETELGASLVETPSTILQEARRLQGNPAHGDTVVIKRGRAPADFGRLDLEQVACERLDHPGLARFLGSKRSPELGTVLAFERLAPNPLLALNAEGTRPGFRDPGTRYYPLPPGVALELAFDVLLAIEHVHARGFLHGGVTLTNLLARVPRSPGATDALAQLATGAYQGVLGGLGGARELTFIEALRAGQVDPELTPQLPPASAAPETLLERAELGGRVLFSPAMDMYAFALLFYTLLTGRTPYDHLVKPAELAHPQVVTELKLREARGEVSPTLDAAVGAVPLHDAPFVVSASEAWPAFTGAVRHLLRRCLDPDPARRMDAATARGLFQGELGLRPTSAADAPRPWVQRTFQMLASSNRLRGDRPARGIWVREEGDALLVEEAPDAPRAAPGEALDVPADVLTRVAIRKERPRPTADPALKRRVPPPVALREVLRAHRAGEPLPVTPPYLVTSTAMDRKALANCLVYSLGAATSWVVVTGDAVQEQIRLIMGRAQESDIVVPDSSVSKRHAALGFERSTGRWYVEDLRSSNGTRVEEREVTPGERARIRKGLIGVQLGTAQSMTYMEAPELKDFLDLVLQAVQRAVETERAGKDEGLADQAPESTLPAADLRPDTAVPGGGAHQTRKFVRPRLQAPSQFPLAQVAQPSPAMDLEGLGRRCAPHLKAGARIRFVLTGAIVEHARTVEQAMSLARESGADTISVEAEYDARRVLLWSRSDRT